MGSRTPPQHGGLRLPAAGREPPPRHRALRRRTLLPRPRGLGDLLEAGEVDHRRRVLQGPLPARGRVRPPSPGQPARRPYAAPAGRPPGRRLPEGPSRHRRARALPNRSRPGRPDRGGRARRATRPEARFSEDLTRTSGADQRPAAIPPPTPTAGRPPPEAPHPRVAGQFPPASVRARLSLARHTFGI